MKDIIIILCNLSTFARSAAILISIITLVLSVLVMIVKPRLKILLLILTSAVLLAFELWFPIALLNYILGFFFLIAVGLLVFSYLAGM